jgi:hypothetical protein
MLYHPVRQRSGYPGCVAGQSPSRCLLPFLNVATGVLLSFPDPGYTFLVCLPCPEIGRRCVYGWVCSLRRRPQGWAAGLRLTSKKKTGVKLEHTIRLSPVSRHRSETTPGFLAPRALRTHPSPIRRGIIIPGLSGRDRHYRANPLPGVELGATRYPARHPPVIAVSR